MESSFQEEQNQARLAARTAELLLKADALLEDEDPEKVETAARRDESGSILGPEEKRRPPPPRTWGTNPLRRACLTRCG